MVIAASSVPAVQDQGLRAVADEVNATKDMR
jgi:hypothetical protein